MTIRSNINAADLNRELTALEDRKDADPLGEAIYSINDELFTFVRKEAEKHKLKVPNDDRWREVEAVLFGALKAVNPELQAVKV